MHLRSGNRLKPVVMFKILAQPALEKAVIQHSLPHFNYTPGLLIPLFNLVTPSFLSHLAYLPSPSLSLNSKGLHEWTSTSELCFPPKDKCTQPHGGPPDANSVRQDMSQEIFCEHQQHDSHVGGTVQCMCVCVCVFHTVLGQWTYRAKLIIKSCVIGSTRFLKLA